MSGEPDDRGPSAHGLEDPPRRVRITSPRRAATGRPHSRPRAHDIDEQTALGELYLDALLRTQARHALVVIAPTALAVLLLIALALVLSGQAGPHADPVPLDWLLVGVAAYPVMCAAAWFYARGAARIEDEFVDLLRRR